MELKLRNIKTMKEANEFLKSYIKELNELFADPIDNVENVFYGSLTPEKINLVLSIIARRKTDNGSAIKYKNKYFSPKDKDGYKVYLEPKTDVLVIKAFDGSLYLTTNEKIYVLEEIEKYKKTDAETINEIKTDKEKKRYIPPLSHPWKRNSY